MDMTRRGDSLAQACMHSSLRVLLFSVVAATVVDEYEILSRDMPSFLFLAFPNER